MKALVVLEHHAGALTRASLGVLSHAAGLAEGTAALVAGGDVAALAPEAVNHGAARVLLAQDARLAAPLPQPRVELLASLVAREGFDTVLFAQSVLASDVAAGLAARLDGGLNWDLTGLELRDGELVGTRPALADSVRVEVGWRSPLRLALLRAGAFDPLEREGSAEVVEVAVELDERALRTTLTEEPAPEESGPPIEDAEIIVAGGRGLGGPDGFRLVEELAQALGGAVGATRAVVDAGWYPYSAQVGQTGKTVSPRLYVALGISGAVQHKVGMQGANVIVAINKDANAPIFEFCDLGVVGDLHTIVPKLTELVRAKRGG